MGTLTQSLGAGKKTWHFAVGGGAILLVWVAVAMPGLHRTRPTAEPTVRELSNPSGTDLALSVGPGSAAFTVPSYALKAGVREQAADRNVPAVEASAARKIIRTSSLDMVVAHPIETAEKITASVEGLGGYLESSNGGGQNATSGALTVRVPADRFEQALAAIRGLALQVESERVDAQDVTRQYVDQDARIRNLQAEETQYLAILKQATTVKDMMTVSQALSEVRGQIEQQQAEFNALSRQIETVSIAISLRTEAQAQTFGLNWRPLYQIKLAVHDGLESVANYATVMVGVLFHLPAVLLWVGTIGVGLLGSWRIFSWAGRCWFGWKMKDSAVQE